MVRTVRESAVFLCLTCVRKGLHSVVFGASSYFCPGLSSPACVLKTKLRLRYDRHYKFNPGWSCLDGRSPRWQFVPSPVLIVARGSRQVTWHGSGSSSTQFSRRLVPVLQAKDRRRERAVPSPTDRPTPPKHALALPSRSMRINDTNATALLWASVQPGNFIYCVCVLQPEEDHVTSPSNQQVRITSSAFVSQPAFRLKVCFSDSQKKKKHFSGGPWWASGAVEHDSVCCLSIRQLGKNKNDLPEVWAGHFDLVLGTLCQKVISYSYNTK